MNADDEITLEEFCGAARRGLELLRYQETSAFRDFPKGQCGNASEMLGLLLKERLGLTSTYVCKFRYGTNKQMQTHAWLEGDDHLIDLTHDQFTGTGQIGWIFPKSNRWHQRTFPHEQVRHLVGDAETGAPWELYNAMRAELDDWPAK